jgi:hypothetical protein
MLNVCTPYVGNVECMHYHMQKMNTCIEYVIEYVQVPCVLHARLTEPIIMCARLIEPIIMCARLIEPIIMCARLIEPIIM